MAISAGDCVLNIGADTKDMDQALSGMAGKVKSSMEKVQASLRIGGAAFTAVGAAGLKMVDMSKEMNAQLGMTAKNLGITTKEMRGLALEVTNVTFPLDEVIQTFDLLARAGVEDQQVLKDVATAFDTLGDAIGMPASLVTENLIPTMKTFNLTAEELAGKTDAMTYLFRNTTVSLEDFNRMVGYVTPDLVKMGLTTEDMIAILADLEDQGYSGEVMTREFRKAVTLAREEQIPLNEALGISTERIESYKGKLEGAMGLTQEYADIANEQYGIMDKVKQKWSELTLEASGFLEPLEPVLAGMTALGPIMIGLSMVKIPNLIGAVNLLGTAIKTALAFTMAHPVIIGIALLIALGVLVWKNWDKICEWADKLRDKLITVFTDIKDFFVGIWEEFSGVLETAKNWGINLVRGLWEGINSLGPWILDKVSGWAKDIFDTIKTGLGKLWPFSPSEAGIDIGKGLVTGIQVGVKGAIGDIHSVMGNIATDLSPGLALRYPVMAAARTPSVGNTVTNNLNITISQLVVREEADVGRIARELLRQQQLRPSYG